VINKLFIAIGFVSLALGIIGVFVPLLPTTPFLLLTAALFFRSSPSLYNKLIKNRWCGKSIMNYREGRGVSLSVKIFTLTVLWVSIISTVVLVQNHVLVSAFLLLMAGAVTMHVLMLKSVSK
jgi:uncharacterized protein